VAFLLDACQSVGQMPVNVDVIGCDMLTATGRKFLRGPRGTGFLYVRQTFFSQLQPFMLDQEGAPDFSEEAVCASLPGARCFEQYEQNFGGKAALAVAIEYAQALGLDRISARVRALASRLRLALTSIEGVKVADVGHELCAIVTFVVRDRDAQIVRSEMHSRGVEACVSMNEGGSKIWFRRRNIASVVRLSPHYFNTEDEIDKCAAVVRDIVAG